MMKRNLWNCVSFQSFGAITASGKVRAAWYVTGTIRVAVCNRIFTRSSWLVSGSKFAVKGGRRKKRRTKLREAGEGYLRHPLHPFPGLMNSLVYLFHWNAG